METIAAESAPGRIRVLSEKVANQIAAGEVVERPASILKELIENSVDAGARHVSVAVRNGGKSHIDVIDDGAGMGRDDALLCIERHATSKIREHGDLNSISTLGFRGEALPSIASVCRMTLATSPAGAMAGTELVIEGGKLLDVRDCAPVMGTRVTAGSLFFNVPARRKFLKGESVEEGHCQEAVIRQALGRIDVGFSYARDGKELFRVAAGERTEDGLAARIIGLFGEKAMRALIPVGRQVEGMRVSGFISRPGGERAARDHQYIYVNRRNMRDKIIYHAVNEAYRSILPRGTYPALFLYIDLPPELVDVNVSPTKAEARFTDNGALIGLVKSGLLMALQAAGAEGGAPIPSGISFAPSEGPPRPAPPMILRETMAPFAPEITPGVMGASITGSPQMGEVPAISPELAQARPLELGLGIPDDARVVGQVFRTFIMLEGGDRLYLVDQHTAHERVNYEALYSRYAEGRVESQELLFPIMVELTPARAELLRAIMVDLGRLGYALEEFGPREFNIRAIPRIMAGAEHKAVILEALERAEGIGQAAGFEKMAEPVINIMACRGAVKAGAKLDPREMESLLRRLAECKLPYTCPHGRPVALSISRDDLYRGFLRK
ncbi:MAG: DNA mismatch repair endonuclease MutL [Nitrospinota bacterium]|nr:DNA mismatch repair endonuclease MutL [Nitrospinota bacterium]